MSVTFAMQLFAMCGDALARQYGLDPARTLASLFPDFAKR
jgi:hypothetical protein